MKKSEEQSWLSLKKCSAATPRRINPQLADGRKVCPVSSDGDRNLSAVGRALKKREIAEAAIASFEQAKTLASAREAVARQISKWDKQLGLILEQPETIGDAMIHAEIRSHLASLKAGERTAFIDVHATEGAAAVLAAPSFLSGLTPAELDVPSSASRRAPPEIAVAKAETAKALQETEAGWCGAIRLVSDRGGLGRAATAAMWPRRVRARAAQEGRGQRLRSLLLWNVRSPLKSRSRPT